MIRYCKPGHAVLSALFFLLASVASHGQSVLPDEILQWEEDIALFDSLNRKGYLQWSEIIKASLVEAGIEP